MEVVDVLAIITFVVLLVAAIWMLVNFYVCDNHSCKVFNDAGAVAEPGTQEYVIQLLDGLFGDGIWPVPYIGAAILTPISLWFMGIPITVRNYAILFFVSFATTYFIIGFFGHHYLRPIAEYVSDYVEDNCPSSAEAIAPLYDDAEPSDGPSTVVCEGEFFPLYNSVTFRPSV